MLNLSEAEQREYSHLLKRITDGLRVIELYCDKTDKQDAFDACQKLFVRSEGELNSETLSVILQLLRAKQSSASPLLWGYENSSDEFNVGLLNFLENFHRELLKKTMKNLFLSGNPEDICKGWKVLGLIMQVNRAMGMRLYYDMIQPYLNKNEKGPNLKNLVRPIEQEVENLLISKPEEICKPHEQPAMVTSISYALQHDVHFAKAALINLERRELDINEQSTLHYNLQSERIHNGAAETLLRERENKLPFWRKIFNWLLNKKDKSKKHVQTDVEKIAGAALQKSGYDFKVTESIGSHIPGGAPSEISRPADIPVQIGQIGYGQSPSTKRTRIKRAP